MMKRKPITKKTTKKKAAPKKAVVAAYKPAIIPSHQWTHNGAEVLLLKCVNADGTSYGGFQWPMKVGASVAPQKWNPKPVCGDGLHGWAWGIGIGGGKEPDWAGRWIVFGAKPEDVVYVADNGGKEKARVGTIRFVGDWQAATNFVIAGQIAWVQHASRGAASATGYSGAASATGDRGAASATGTRGAASATGDGGAASATGDGGAASATGTRGAASATGDGGAAVAGYYGRARAGKFGCVAIAWWNSTAGRQEMRCREVGVGDGSDGKLKAGVWYRLGMDGAFVEV